MLTAKQIRKLAKATTDHEFVQKGKPRKPATGGGIWHDAGGTIIFAEEPDQKLRDWARDKKCEFGEVTSGVLDHFRKGDEAANVELFPVEIAGVTDDHGKQLRTFVRLRSQDEKIEEWANAGYVAAVFKRGAEQFFRNSKREIAARNGRTVALFMPMNFGRDDRPRFNWRLANTDLPSG